MAEKLSITIFLDGAAEIERQLEGIGQAGTKAFDAIGTAAEKVGGFDKLDPKDVTKKLEQFGVKGKAAIDKITAAVAQAGRLERIVGGVRQIETGFASIGVAASAMSTKVTSAFTTIATAAAGTGGAIGRVGRALGILGSGALIGSVGAAAVAMEKTADAARVLEGNLQALFRNAKLGSAIFLEIQNAAQTAGAGLESTGQTMVGIIKTINKALAAKGIRFAPAEEFKQATAGAAGLLDTLQKGMKLTGTRAGDAQKAIKALFTEIDTKGELSGNALRELAARFPQLANELVKFLGMPGESMDKLADRVDRGLKKIRINDFINALRRADPEIQKLFKQFEPTIAQRMDTIAGAWDRLLNSFGKSPAGAAIKGAMDDIAKGLDEIAKKQEQVGRFTVDKPPATVTGGFLEQMFKEFDENIKIATANWDRLVKLVTAPIQAGADLWQWLLDGFDGIVEKIKIKAQELADFLKKILTQSPVQGGQIPQGVPLLGQPRDFLPDSPLSENIEDRRGEGAIDTTAINTALAQLATAAEQATISLQSLQGLEFSSIATAADSLNTAISSLAGSMQSLTFSGMAEAFATATAAAQQLGTDLQNLGLSEVAAAMQEVVAAANSAAQALSSIQAQGGNGGFASGGLLGGRGTGTSDSNLAWVSRGEHIMPARAVRQPGVLAFLEALRRSGGSLADVLDDMGRFALGGLVPRTMPAFATGGLADMRPAGGGRPIALTINAGGGERQTFHLWADEQVADSVLRYATKRQVASAGRKSGAFG